MRSEQARRTTRIFRLSSGDGACARPNSTVRSRNDPGRLQFTDKIGRLPMNLQWTIVTPPLWHMLTLRNWWSAGWVEDCDTVRDMRATLLRSKGYHEENWLKIHQSKWLAWTCPYCKTKHGQRFLDGLKCSNPGSSKKKRTHWSSLSSPGFLFWSETGLAYPLGLLLWISL